MRSIFWVFCQLLTPAMNPSPFMSTVLIPTIISICYLKICDNYYTDLMIMISQNDYLKNFTHCAQISPKLVPIGIPSFFILYPHSRKLSCQKLDILFLWTWKYWRSNQDENKNDVLIFELMIMKNEHYLTFSCILFCLNSIIKYCNRLKVDFIVMATKNVS